jgi:23S rRNA (uracil1939-C5)-methyltransferase
VGLFGLSLSGQVQRVIGVEADSSAAADFRHNAQGLAHVELVEGAMETVLPRIGGPVDLLVLDPPRSGAGAGVVGEIGRLSPRRVVYVSCDPATLARDASHLVEAGYDLEEVQPVDLSPQTCHVESVVLFVRRA